MECLEVDVEQVFAELLYFLFAVDMAITEVEFGRIRACLHEVVLCVVEAEDPMCPGVNDLDGRRFDSSHPLRSGIPKYGTVPRACRSKTPEAVYLSVLIAAMAATCTLAPQ